MTSSSPRRPSLNPFDFANFLQTRFRDSGPTRLFTYDTDVLDLIAGPCKDISSVECFAHYRQGYCQFYASTMAIFLREQGIPSRIVEGFLPGKRSATGEEPIGNGQSHQWVEVYFPGYGWVPFDPTGGERRQAARRCRRVRRSRAPRGRCRSIPLPSRLGDNDFRDPDEVTGGASHDVEQPRGAVDRHRPSCSLVIVGALAFIAWQRGPRSRDDRRPRLPDGHPARRRGSGSGRARPRPSTSSPGASARCCRSCGPSSRLVAQAKVETAYGRGILGDGPPAGPQGRGAAAAS